MPVNKRINISEPGLAFVTTTVRKHINIFKDEKIAAAAVNQFRETCAIKHVSVVGYVPMPSHLHAMIGLRKIDELQKFMQTYKGLSSRQIKCLLDDSQRQIFLNDKGLFNIWKRRFDDLIIISEKQFKIKLNYIHNNPVKAGLVRNAVDYRYSSANCWMKGGSGLIEIDKDYKWLEDV